jgi:hypothetical protein
LPLVAGGRNIFGQSYFSPGRNALDYVAGRRQRVLPNRHANVGVVLVQHVAPQHVRNDFQKINVFADESFAIRG